MRFDNNVCYEKFVTHLLLYTVANVSRIFRNRRYKPLVEQKILIPNKSK